RAGGPPGRVRLRGETRGVGAEPVARGAQRLLAAVGLMSPLDPGRKRLECERKTFAGRVDGAGLGHSRHPPGRGRYRPDSTAVWRKNLLRRQAVTKIILRCARARRPPLTP